MLPNWRFVGDPIVQRPEDDGLVWHSAHKKLSYQEFCITMCAQSLGSFERKNVVWIFELDELLRPQPYWLDEESGILAPAKEIWAPPKGVRQETLEEGEAS